MTLRIPSSSIEYLSVPVTSSVSLSGLPVYVALIPPGSDPVSGDWKAASWSGSNATILIGPGQTIVPSANTTYIVWVKVTANPETPVMRAGVLQTL